MINFLHIENFQSHKESDLIFSPGVNVIVGTSDSGKSAIIRALRWVVYNRPSGNDIRSWWGGKTEVQVGIEDEKILVRRKDKAEEYILAKSGRKDISFKAFGTDVPAEISKELQISDINLQYQMDKPFLLSASAGEVATHFNKVARLDKIDSALQNVNKWVRDLTTDIKYKEQEIKTLTVQQSNFDYLEKMEMDLEVQEELQKRFESKFKSYRQLSDLINTIIDLGIEIQESEPLLKMEESVFSVIGLIKEKSDKETAFYSLVDFVEDIHTIDTKLEDFSFDISLKSSVDEILSLIESKKAKASLFTSLSTIVEDINDIRANLNDIVDSTALKEKEFKENMGDVCPLCGTNLKKKQK